MKKHDPHPTLRTVIASVLVAGLLAGCATNDAQLQSEAKLSQADAQKIALARVPNGTIKESELEKEKGRLIWSFDVATPSSSNTTEVNIDAVTGEIVDVSTE